MGTAATKSQAWGRKVVALATSGPHPFQVDEGADVAKREVPLEAKHLRRYERGEDATVSAVDDPLAELTARQLAVWFLIRVSRAGVRKFSRREIARTLHCSPATVAAEYRKVVGRMEGKG